ncbi:helix-turn-helix domain-containing protein [Sulfurovum riftiae]|uniref:HTH cro/C1-type domain-containing protein n=1 Tax=Sulfurovum riftiae TaxID=1630136 RepID=A0A151CDH3_9BACT|nr:helix-turn-helix transcriptional regulator [Sulfurovum riftiae]KYJ85519.1 hypothetical protein AS592_04195 [Sulfurovum riftiae]
MEFYEIGNRLKTLRKEKGMTQEDVAVQLGITRQTLSKLEKGEIGKVSLLVFLKLLDLLGQELQIEEKKPFYYFDPKDL